MIKKFLMVILGVLLLAVVVVTVHLPSRHTAYSFYSGFQLYLNMDAAFKTEPACQEDEKINLCITTILNNSGGFKFGTDVGFALAVLFQKNLSYNSFVQSNVIMTRAIDPEKFWIRRVKGKTAKRLFKQEKKELAKTLTDSKELILKSIKEGRFPSSHDDQAVLVQVLEEKIAELTK